MMPPMAIPIPMVLVSDDESCGDIDDWLFESIGTPSRTTPPMLPLPNTPAKLPLPHHDVARIADDEIEDMLVGGCKAPDTQDCLGQPIGQHVDLCVDLCVDLYVDLCVDLYVYLFVHLYVDIFFVF